MKTTQKEPTAKIAVRKNVLKQYRVNNEDVIYLAKNAEFEIEMHNPLQETILARIFLNGKEIPGDGLVLRPGERIFLERYLEVDKKFKFDVYQVEDTQENKTATANNGLVTVKFYKELDLRVRDSGLNRGTITWYNSNTPFYGSTCNTLYSNNVTIGTTTDAASAATFTSSCANTSKSKSLDTGIISKGSTSQQALQYVDMNFQTYPFASVVVRILPDSLQHFTKDDIKYRKYCTECGSKIKATDKYCAECGEKL